MINVERSVTSTALTRRYEKDPKLARTLVVDLEAFDASRYHRRAVELAAEALTALARGEYLAVDLFARLSAQLAVHAAPFDIIAAATRAQSDELRHAELAITAAKKLAGREVTFSIDPEQHATLGRKLSLAELDGFMAELPAIGESLACSMIAQAHEQCTDPVLRRVWGGLLRDEVHHARLGWYYLEWRSRSWTLEERQALADRVGRFVVEIEVMFSRGRDAPRGAGKDARGLGVMDTKTQRSVVRRAMEDEIVPGLDGLGLGASHAWRARKRL